MSASVNAVHLPRVHADFDALGSLELGAATEKFSVGMFFFIFQYRLLALSLHGNIRVGLAPVTFHTRLSIKKDATILSQLFLNYNSGTSFASGWLFAKNVLQFSFFHTFLFVYEPHNLLIDSFRVSFLRTILWRMNWAWWNERIFILNDSRWALVMSLYLAILAAKVL